METSEFYYLKFSNLIFKYLHDIEKYNLHTPVVLCHFELVLFSMKIMIYAVWEMSHYFFSRNAIVAS